MNFIIKYKKIAFVVIFITTLFCSFGLFKLKIDYDFDSYFDKTDSVYLFYTQTTQTFNIHQHTLIIVAFDYQTSIYDKIFLQKTDSICNQIANISGIEKAYFLTNAVEDKISPWGIQQTKIAPFKTQEQIKYLEKKASQKNFLYNNFISKDNKSICAYFYIQPHLFNLTKRDSICNSIENILKASQYKYYLYGIPFLRTQFAKKIITDSYLFVCISAIFLILSLFYVFRNGSLVFISGGSILLGLIWTFGLMGWLGYSVNMLTNMLIPIITIVGVSDSIHLINSYIENFSRNKNSIESLKHTIKEVGGATFFTAIISAIGFLSLSITDVEAIKFFGMFGFFGILFTFIISIVIIPNFLVHIPQNKIFNSKAFINSRQWDIFFTKLYEWVIKFKNRILFVLCLIMLVCCFYITQISKNLFFLEDIKKTDPLWISAQFFENNFSGIKPFDIVVNIHQGQTISDIDILNNLANFQDSLSKMGVFSEFLSIINVLKYENYVYHKNHIDSFKIPHSQEDINFLFSYLSNNNNYYTLISPKNNTTILSARTKDIGSEEIEKIKKQITTIAAPYSHQFDIRITGFGECLDTSNKTIRSNLFYGLLIDFLIISIIMFFLFKNVNYFFISLIPNIIPLIITGGIIGFLGIPFSPSNTIIFIIIFGISIDDTIHFLTHYLLIQKTDKTPILRVLLTTGKAMVITSIILMSGTFSLCFSNFGTVANIGLFTFITLITATLSEFLITPILIHKLGNKPLKRK